jgi:hypothetical protein
MQLETCGKGLNRLGVSTRTDNLPAHKVLSGDPAPGAGVAQPETTSAQSSTHRPTDRRVITAARQTLEGAKQGLVLGIVQHAFLPDLHGASSRWPTVHSTSPRWAAISASGLSL